jgi:hypothetical protein
MLHAGSARELVDILVHFVAELGGGVRPAATAGPDALPLDLSLGDGPPMLPVADRYSIARMQLERVLPTVLEDARRAAALVRSVSQRSKPSKLPR